MRVIFYVAKAVAEERTIWEAPLRQDPRDSYSGCPGRRQIRSVLRLIPWYLGIVVRIIGGLAGGRRLRRVAARGTRPTADRVRQAIFNLLAARYTVPDAVLDLYAGSGALGFEALSRGAKQAVFIEHDRKAAKAIGESAERLGVAGQVTIVCARVQDWIKRSPAAPVPFGWVFADPPYAEGRAGELDGCLALLARSSLLGSEAIVIAEYDRPDAIADAYGSLERRHLKKYGQTYVSFFTAAPGSSPASSQRVGDE